MLLAEACLLMMSQAVPSLEHFAARITIEAGRAKVYGLDVGRDVGLAVGRLATMDAHPGSSLLVLVQVTKDFIFQALIRRMSLVHSYRDKKSTFKTKAFHYSYK